VHKVPHSQILSCHFGGSNDGSSAMAAAPQQVALTGLKMSVGGFNLGLGSPGLGTPNGLNMAQLAQLNGMTGMNGGMNPFNMNMLGMANLSAMGISPEAQLLAAQIAAAGGGFGQANLAGLGGLGGFGGMQNSIGGLRGPSRSGGRSPGLSANGKSGSSSAGNGSSAKKDEEDFDPVVRVGKCSRLSRSSGGKWGSMIRRRRRCRRVDRRPLRLRRWEARLVVVVGCPRREI
jgi:hypothetical protein